MSLPEKSNNIVVEAEAAPPSSALLLAAPTNKLLSSSLNQCEVVAIANGVRSKNGVSTDDGVNHGSVESKEGRTDVPVEPVLARRDDGGGNSSNGPTITLRNNVAMNIPEENHNLHISDDTPSSSPRRIVKKKRSEDYVYASDSKTHEEEEKQPAAAIITSDNNNNHHTNNNNGAAVASAKSPTPPEIKKPSKTTSQPPCPILSDSILIDVPLSVTADLGVALKRTRRKRIQRIQDWVVASSASAASSVPPPDGRGDKTKKKKNKQIDSGRNKSENDQHDHGDDDSSCPLDSSNHHGDDDDGDERDITLDYFNDLDDDDDAFGKTPKRDQFGSVLDYLEAKYCRGVMIADYDDRELAKKKKRKKKKKRRSGDDKNNMMQEEEGEDDEDEEDSEGDNSCYDDDDGFIDDSLMLEDVAGQVMASSTYGLTQIEKEARRRRDERKSLHNNTESTNNALEKQLGIAAADDGKNDDNNLVDGVGIESDFDDGFFVNLGDLEMAEGWSGENVVISPTKKKRTKKRVKASVAAKDDRPPKKTKTDEKKKTNTSSSSSTSPQKKKKSDDSMKQNSEGSMGSSKATSMSPKNGKKTTTMASSGKSEDKQPRKKEQVVKQPKKMLSPEKDRAAQLRKLMKRKYNVCVKMIKDLTDDQLPRKKRSKNTVKLLVNIPEGKTIGDEITFANPNIPGQKLKVQIPAKADMEKRTFVASVPGPKVPSTKKENNLPKEFKEALCEYSHAYDDWCAAHNESLPELKRKYYKINVEKMKKFDEMVKEFPNNLATPIDAAYLRAAVRRVKGNKAKQEKRKSGAESPQRRMVMEKIEINITVPQKGSEFALLSSFNKQDFEE